MKSIIATTLVGVLIGTVAGTAQATTASASGSLWHVPEAISKNAILANVPGTTADVTFNTTGVLAFSASGATVGTWLNSDLPNISNIVENTPGTLASLMDNGTTGTLVELTGSVHVNNGEVFNVTHDDGLSLIINGVDMGFSPLPTSPVVSSATWTGATGDYAFTLVYGECCGGPAVLNVQLGLVPEPETYAMFLAGLGLMGFMARRRKTS